MPYKDKAKQRLADAKYREKKKREHAESYNQSRAKIQKKYRERVKEVETPREVRMRKKKHREQMRCVRARKDVPLTVEIIDLDAMEDCQCIETTPKSVSSLRREKKRVVEERNILREENIRLQKRVWRLQKRDERRKKVNMI
jgi:hypothetical protein